MHHHLIAFCGWKHAIDSEDEETDPPIFRERNFSPMTKGAGTAKDGELGP